VQYTSPNQYRTAPRTAGPNWFIIEPLTSLAGADQASEMHAPDGTPILGTEETSRPGHWEV